MPYQSVSDLMNADAMQQAQLYGALQQMQMRNLQMQDSMEERDRKKTMRDLFQNIMQQSTTQAQPAMLGTGVSLDSPQAKMLMEQGGDFGADNLGAVNQGLGGQISAAKPAGVDYDKMISGLMGSGNMEGLDAGIKLKQMLAKDSKSHLIPVGDGSGTMFNTETNSYIQNPYKKESKNNDPLNNLFAMQDDLRAKGMPENDPRMVAIANRIRKESEVAGQIVPKIVVNTGDKLQQQIDLYEAKKRIDAEFNQTKSDVKLQASLPQAKTRTALMEQTADRLINALKDLEDDPGLSNITGAVFGRTPSMTDDGNRAQGKLDSIKSNIFQSALQSMREASKTGGAVGNVSDKEGDRLEKTLSGLHQPMGTKDFKGELVKARKQVEMSKSIIKNAFDEQFGNMLKSDTQLQNRLPMGAPGTLSSATSKEDDYAPNLKNPGNLKVSGEAYQEYLDALRMAGNDQGKINAINVRARQKGVIK